MATQYTLNFSDPSKTNTIVITGPTKNSYSTSLDLVGPGYVAYGETIAQDFLRLLENFASPNAPANPIEGQLWYDTSNPGRKVLRVNNGSPTSARWPSANGIYQQANDPSIEYSQTLVDGDIWVDIGNSQVKIRNGNAWTLVGPNVSTGTAKTGNESANLESNLGETYPVILNWVNGKVVEIIAYNAFTPRTVIDGFSTIVPGINLTTKVSAKFNGLADKAKKLEISNGIYVEANEVLKNTVPSSQRQIHAGSLIVESAQGLFIRRPNQTNKEIKIGTSTGTSVGLIEYGFPTGSLKVGVTDRAYIYFDGDARRVGINTSANTGTLTVNGSAYINGGITSNGSLSLTGSATIAGNTVLTGNLNVYGAVEISTSSNIIVGNVIPINSTTDLGSASNPFESVYVRNIGSSTTFVNIYGNTDTATSLQTLRDFQLSGQLASNLIKFNGTASVILVTTATSSLITDQPALTTATNTATMMVVNSGTLSKITKNNFLADVYPNLLSTGMIMAYATSATTATVAAGWLFCNGSEYISTATTCSNLFNLIGYQYGTPVDPLKFKVPDLTNITTATGGYPIYYHIKT
jgi:hypothetical protein